MSANLEKISQLRSELQAHDIDVLLILSREDSDVVLPLLLPVHVVAQSAFFFCSEGPHIVLTGRTDANMYREFGEFEVIEIEEDFQKDFTSIFNRLKPRKLALNISGHDYLSDGLTVGQYQMLIDMIGANQLAEIECSSQPIISKLRSIKSHFEIEQIRTAVQITCEIYDEVAKMIRVGMSETDIGQLFVDQMRSRGVTNALGAPFDYPLVCINRCGLAHRKPNERNILQAHDLLICDFSIMYNGYCSDIARGFYALGPDESVPPADVQRAFDTAVSAVTAVLEGIKPGIKGFEVDKLGRDVIEEAGYPTIRHAVGHQLGRRVHDGGTSLSPNRDDRPSSRGTIQVGEVYAVEPTVIQDGGLPSFIVEEDILVTEDGVTVLSTRQLGLYCIRKRVAS